MMKSKKQIILTTVLFLTLALLVGCSSSGGNPSKPLVLAIETQPLSVAVTEGEEVVLLVTMEAADRELSYQWFETRDPVNRNSDDIQIIGNEGEFIPPDSFGGIVIAGATDTTHRHFRD